MLFPIVSPCRVITWKESWQKIQKHAYMEKDGHVPITLACGARYNFDHNKHACLYSVAKQNYNRKKFLPNCTGMERLTSTVIAQVK